MNIRELENKCYLHVQIIDKYSYLLTSEEKSLSNQLLKLSIQFAIEILEEIGTYECTEISTDDLLWAKIEELKKYL